MQAEGDPKCRTEARFERSPPGYLEEHEPDSGRADANADGERSNHPTTVMHDVVTADGPYRKHQARQKPQAEYHCGTGLRQSTEGEQAAEDQRKDAADYACSGKDSAEPSMEGVVAAADPVGELQWRQKQ